MSARAARLASARSQRGDQPVVAFVADGLAIAAGLVTVASIFPVFDSGGLADRDIPSALGPSLVLAVAMLAFGVLLLVRGVPRPMGAIALTTLVLLILTFYLEVLSTFWQRGGPHRPVKCDDA